MRKYLILFQLAWQRTLIYRGMNAVYLLIGLLHFFLSIGIWTVAYQSPQFRSPETFATFVSYFIFTILLSRIVFSWTFDDIAERGIKYGELSIFLLKPIPYFWQVVIREIPWRLQQLIMTLPIVFLVWFIYSAFVRVNLLWLLLAIAIGVVAYILSFLINVFFASLAFWFEDNQGIASLWEVSSLLFSGVGIPIFFFPPLLQTVSSLLPFQYILYFPVTVALGKLTVGETVINFTYLVGWIVLFILIVRKMWSKGLKKFTGEGI